MAVVAEHSKQPGIVLEKAVPTIVEAQAVALAAGLTACNPLSLKSQAVIIRNSLILKYLIP